MLYRIEARYSRATGEWTSTGAIPTFYLHTDVQGIRDENHAKRIALRILQSGDPMGATTFSVVVVPCPEGTS